MPPTGIRHGRRGVGLLEVIVAFLLLGLVISTLLGVALNAHRSDTASADQDAAVTAVESLSAVLSNYVSADVTPASSAWGPGGSWNLPGDSCVYALALGCTHNATSFLPASVMANHPAATLTYTVTQSGADAPRDVEFQVSW